MYKIILINTNLYLLYVHTFFSIIHQHHIFFFLQFIIKTPPLMLAVFICKNIRQHIYWVAWTFHRHTNDRVRILLGRAPQNLRLEGRNGRERKGSVAVYSVYTPIQRWQNLELFYNKFSLSSLRSSLFFLWPSSRAG